MFVVWDLYMNVESYMSTEDVDLFLVELATYMDKLTVDEQADVNQLMNEGELRQALYMAKTLAEEKE
jgi:hypothetical protein